MQHGWKVKEANDKQRQLEQKEARKQTLAADERVVDAMKQRRDSSRTRKEVLSISDTCMYGCGLNNNIRPHIDRHG